MWVSRKSLAIGAHRILLLLVLGAAYRCSAGPITYYVNQTIGAGGVTGYIVTDGTTGFLSSNNIVNWDLLLSNPTELCGGIPCTFDLVGPPNGTVPQLVAIRGTDLSATATQLLFNFSGTDGGLFLFETDSIGSLCFTAGINCLAFGLGAGESLGIGFGHSVPFTALSGTQ